MAIAMIRSRMTLACLAAAMIMPGRAFAQQTDPQAAAQPASGLAGKVKVDQAGGIHFTKHFAVVFGGIKQGSSIAVGPAVSWEFKDGGFLQIKGGYSVRQFKLLQV